MKKLILGLVLGMLIGSATVAFAASNDLIGTEVKAVFASFNLVINGEAKELNAVPLVYNGTSYLPVKEVANLTGFDVTYKADSRTIELNKSEKVVSNLTTAAATTIVEWISLKDLALQVTNMVLGPLGDKNNVLVITRNDVKIEIFDLVPPTGLDHGTFQLSNGGSIDVKFLGSQTLLPISKLKELNIIV